MPAPAMPPKTVCHRRAQVSVGAVHGRRARRDVRQDEGHQGRGLSRIRCRQRAIAAPIAARVKDAERRSHVGRLSRRRRQQLLEALGKLDYKPPRHFYLYPSSGPLAVLPAGRGRGVAHQFRGRAALQPDDPSAAQFAREFNARAVKAGLPFPHADSQAANEYAGWQILVAAVNATKSLDDKTLADWLEHNSVDTLVRQARLQRQVPHQQAPTTAAAAPDPGQAKWVAVWPAKERDARRQARWRPEPRARAGVRVSRAVI